MLSLNFFNKTFFAFIALAAVLVSCQKGITIEASDIYGLTSLCLGEKNVLYYTEKKSADHILWTVPDDAVIVSGQGSDTVRVDFGRTPGRISAVLYKDGEPISKQVFIDVTFGVAGEWCRETNIYSGGRSGCVAFSIGSKGYIATGFNATSQRKNDLWEYDSETFTWMQKKDLPASARLAAVGFSIGNKGYLGTGYKGEGVGVDNFFSDFYEYNPATNVWEEKAPVPGPGRQYAIGFSANNKGYIGSGQNGISSTPLTDFYEYNPDLNQWFQKNNTPYPRISPVTFSIGNKGYIGTGQKGQGTVFYNDFYEYDSATDVWTPKSPLPGAARFGAAAFSIGNKGYVGAGFSSGTIYGDFWEYDFDSDSWTPLPSLEQGRGFPVGFSIGNKGYLGTGNTTSSTVFEDLWVYTQ